MAYFDPKTNVNYDNKIVYDLFTTSINKNEVQSPSSNSSINYFKVPFYNGTPNPNFYYTSGGVTNNYVTKNIYIFGLLHNNITGITDKNPNIIGEVVIELSSTSAGSAYLCLLLEKPPPYGAPPSGDIDSILALPKSNNYTLNVSLNNSITSQENAIVYKNNGATVFVFTDTIVIDSDSANKIFGSSGVGGFDITTTLFSANSTTDYVIIPTKNISIKQDEQIYIDCNPTGESDATMNTYNVPINSELMNEKQQLDYMKQTVDFAIFSLIVVICYFLVPSFYKFIVIDKIFRIHPNVITNGGANSILTRIRSADILIGAFFIITAYVLFQTGISTNNATMYHFTLYILVFYGLSLSLIGLNKTRDEFMCLGGGGANECHPYIKGQPDKFFSFKDIWSFLGIFLNFTIFEAGPRILVVDLLIFLMLLLLWLFKQFDTSTFIFSTVFGCGYLVPIIVSLLSVITIANEG